jgi:hypothetical protein
MATTFATMPRGSLNGWLNWCHSHEWGQGDRHEAYYDDMTGEMVTFGQEHDGFNWMITEARHKTPAELKAWAGY